MSPIEFSLQVILVSTSGVLSPGPLFFINILYGSRYGSFIGLKIASGHAIVEFPLIIALSYGLYSFSYTLHLSDIIFKFIGLLGGIFLLLFSILVSDRLDCNWFEAFSIKNNDFLNFSKIPNKQLHKLRYVILTLPNHCN